ncbi:MAG: hypothetical protein ABSG43_17160 [Solirubrobacteraceae bacterium]|jgi:hypothetical protein
MPARASATASGFSPGQVWQPKRGHPGPAIEIANIHRADRLVETIDAGATDRLTAKRTVIGFRDLRAHYNLQQDAGKP